MKMSKREEKLGENYSHVPPSDWTIFVRAIPMRIAILTFCGGSICVFPFLVLVMQQLGISFAEIAIMFLVTPAASLIGPVFAGLIADKLGKYGIVFIINILLMAISFNALLFIPPSRIHISNMSCDLDTNNLVFIPHNCEQVRQTWGDAFENATLQNCKLATKQNVSVHLQESCFPFNATSEINLYGNFSERQGEKCFVSLSSLSYGNASLSSSCNQHDDQNCTCNVECEVTKVGAIAVKRSDTYDQTFYMALFSMFFGMWFAHAAFTMMDATTMAYVQKNGLELGKEKIVGMVGFALTPMLAGFLIDQFSDDSGQKNYAPAFILASALMATSALIISFLNIEVEATKSNVVKDLVKLITKLEVNLFLMIVLILGILMGFIETYLFIFLETLNAPGFLLGLTLTVGCLASIPMLYFADAFERKVGRHNVFLICFTAYSIRMLGYSFIQNPWMCLIFECLEAITYQQMWLTSLKLCPILATRNFLATMTGLLGSVHYAFGKGIGGFLGGKVIEAYTIRIAYRVFAGISFGGGIFYLIIHHLYLKNVLIIREKELEEADRLRAQNELESSEEKSTLLNNRAVDQEDRRTSENLNTSLLNLSGTLGGAYIDNCLEVRNRQLGKSMQKIYIADSVKPEDKKFSKSENSLHS